MGISRKLGRRFFGAHASTSKSWRRMGSIAGRGVGALCLFTGVLTAAVAISATPATAAPGQGTAFDCSGAVVYNVTTTSGGLGSTQEINSVVPSTGVLTPIVAASGSEPNALGLTQGGTDAWYLDELNAGTIFDYNTSTQVTTSFPDGDSPGIVVAGAIDPVNGIYYFAHYASGTATIYGFNTVTKTSIPGVIATAPLAVGGGAANGDLAFDTLGNMYMVDSVGTTGGIATVKGPLPTTAVGASLTSTTLTTSLPGATTANGFNGITFLPNGNLVVQRLNGTNAAAVYVLNPNTAAIISGPTSITGAGVDLGSCTFNPTLNVQKNVIGGRYNQSDQFTMTVTGGGITMGNTATTTGTAKGIQAAQVGPLIGITGTTYTIAETAASGSLSNYTTTFSCVDTNTGTTVTSGSGTSFSLVFPSASSGENAPNVNCIFSNTPAPNLSLTKALGAPRNASTDQFTMQIHTGSPSGPVVNNTTNSTTTGTGSTVTPGSGTTGVYTTTAGTTYFLTEAASGTTNLSLYASTITCSDANGNQTGLPNNAPFSGSLAITPVASSSISCTLTNTALPTPGFTTTIAAPPGTPPPTSVGNSWNDVATVTGTSTGGAPTGTVTFTFCKETTPPTTCTGGSTVGTLSAPTSTSGNVSTYTLPGSDAQTPANVGTYCYNAAYAGSTSYAPVAQQSDTECFSVTPANSTSTTQQSTTSSGPGSIVIGPTGSVTDTATVTGNTTGGVPGGTVTFTECGPTTSAALCPSGTPVGSPVTLSGTGHTSTATSASFTPTAVGVYCFAAVYTPAGGSNYNGSSDNMTGTVDTNECFTLNPAPTQTTTQQSASGSGEGTIVIGPSGSVTDTATVTGNTTGGVPGGTITFTECGPTTSAALCPSGTPVGSPVTLSGSGHTSTATSASFTPTAVGTYCFAAVYTPNTGSNYSGSTDNMTGTVDLNECFTLTPAPSQTTTQQSASSSGEGTIVIGPTGSVTDTATVTGNTTGGVPGGTITFTECGPTTSAALCASGTPVGSPVTLSGTGHTSSATSASFTPTAVGTYCFAAVYTPNTGSNYLGSSDNVTGDVQANECFTVTPAPSQTTTQQSASGSGEGTIVIGPTGSVTDTATVTGNTTAGVPGGTITFTECGPTTSAALCPSGTPVGSPVTLSGTGHTSTATSASFTPTAVGTYCFAAVYTPNTGSNYLGSSDNVTGDVQANECFTVTPAPSQTTTQQSASSSGEGTLIVGGSITDTATVTGNTTAGLPGGTVTFTECGPTTSPAVCAAGTPVGSPVTLSGTGHTSTATSASFTPTAVGTYCFAAVYTPNTGSNYQGSSHNTTGTVDLNECVSVGAAPSQTTTQQSTTSSGPGSIVIGPTGSVTDTATVTGNTTGGVPGGTITFTECGPTTSAALCPSGTPVGSPVTLSGSGHTSTATSVSFTPTAVGTYCFAAVYTPNTGSNYSGSTDNMTGTVDSNECFTLNPAPTQTTTQQSASGSGEGTIVIGPTGSVTDTATVTGNTTAGVPGGTITFTECGPTTSAALCPSGTPVGSPVTLSGTGDTSSATSASFTPTAVGTYCFAAVYTPNTGSNYLGSSDNVTGDVQANECFTVTPAPSQTTTQQSASSSGEGTLIVGGSITDTATVTGNTTAGLPGGTVTFTECGPTTSPAVCAAGTPVGSPVTLSGTGHTSTATSASFTPTAVGTYCFAAVYTPNTGSNYQGSSHNTTGTVDLNECVSVGAAPSQTTTQQSTTSSGPGSIVIGPTGSVTDTATVTGNTTGGVPGGTITFTECGPTTSAALCPSGTPVGSPVTLSGSGHTSTATSVSFTPTAVGTYCFAAVYTPNTGSNYSGSTDNMTGTVDSNECFTLNPAPTQTTTQQSASGSGEGTIVIGPTGSVTDTATVTGNTTAGVPGGTITFTECGPTTSAGPVRRRHPGGLAGHAQRDGRHLERHLGLLHADRGRDLLLRGRLHAQRGVQLPGLVGQRHGRRPGHRVLHGDPGPVVDGHPAVDDVFRPGLDRDRPHRQRHRHRHGHGQHDRWRARRHHHLHRVRPDDLGRPVPEWHPGGLAGHAQRLGAHLHGHLGLLHADRGRDLLLRGRLHPQHRLELQRLDRQHDRDRRLQRVLHAQPRTDADHHPAVGVGLGRGHHRDRPHRQRHRHGHGHGQHHRRGPRRHHHLHRVRPDDLGRPVPERHPGGIAGHAQRDGRHLERHLGLLHADRGRDLLLRGRLHPQRGVQLPGLVGQRHGRRPGQRVLHGDPRTLPDHHPAVGVGLG